LAGSCASVLSACALSLAGHRFAGAAAAPINAVSHWWWDREALSQQKLDGRHTVVGYWTHHAASTFWGLLLAAFLSRQPHLDRNTGIVAASAATSAIAYFVDFKLTPRRLTPGFEERLPTKALIVTYLVFAVGLVIGCAASRSRR
jgi:hypothetical protein